MISGSAQIHIAMLLTALGVCRDTVLFVAGLPRSADPAATETLATAATPMAPTSCFRSHDHQILRPNLTVCETDPLYQSSSECDTAALLDLLATSDGIILALCDAQCLRPSLWKVVKQTKCYHHGRAKYIPEFQHRTKAHVSVCLFSPASIDTSPKRLTTFIFTTPQADTTHTSGC